MNIDIFNTQSNLEQIATQLDVIKLQLVERLNNGEPIGKIMKSEELRSLHVVLPTLPDNLRAAVGQSINDIKKTLVDTAKNTNVSNQPISKAPIDVTAPRDSNSARPALLPVDQSSRHPVTTEISTISEIFQRMGFTQETSREIDDQYHMFESVNFPHDHPARDEYDTFLTIETDTDGSPLIAPAHTSTMQHRILKKYKDQLEQGQAIAAIIPDRVFRNEDLDARHGHTFYQLEGIYVSRDVTVGMLIATLQEFLENYYGRTLEVRLNPFYFPFTEPSFEFALSCPFCDKVGCSVCSQEGWIELLGCGMIHPNVLSMAGLDPAVYNGFAFGCGIDRLVMMKYNIEDLRHFHSGKLNFLRQFN